MDCMKAPKRVYTLAVPVCMKGRGCGAAAAPRKEASHRRHLQVVLKNLVRDLGQSCIHLSPAFRARAIVRELPDAETLALLQAGQVAMVDYDSIPGAVRIDMRPEAVAQRINPRALAMLDTAPDAAPPATAAAAATAATDAAAPPAAAAAAPGVLAPGTPHALAPAPAPAVETQQSPAPQAVAQSAG